MELMELKYRKDELRTRYAHLTYLPPDAVDVEVIQTEDEVIVQFTLPGYGEIPHMMGHC